MKNLFSLTLIAFVLVVGSCGKSDDPKPITPQTNLDKVKESLVGTWDHASMSITGLNSSNVKTTLNFTGCDFPANNIFPSLGWKTFVSRYYRFVFKTTIVNLEDPCVFGSGLDGAIIPTANSDGTINLAVGSLGDKVVANYTVDPKDITNASVKVSVVNPINAATNPNGWTIIIIYTRK
ncbi:MAG: hypothetical protein HOP37_09900 [Cyclobacteriaceae bacterium]|nr:hypothetical protein [Cyclobacteriaceae bacterium]